MRIKKSRLKEIIKEELDLYISEQMSMADERKFLEAAMEEESLCYKWALKTHESDYLRYIKLSGAERGMSNPEFPPVPPALMDKCPYKKQQNEVGHEILFKVRDRIYRSNKGLPPAEDDDSVIGKVRDRIYRSNKGLPPAEDDDSVIAKYRRSVAQKIADFRSEQ